jgi:serine/threonine-protein kinase RsbT
MVSQLATLSGVQPLRGEQDVVTARQMVRKLAQECGFSLIDQTKLVTAASELGRNAVKYGGGGEMRWALLQDGARQGVQLVFADEGPGIADLELAMTDGWTSGGGLGMGLSGAKRLVNDFRVDTQVGGGTRVTVARWK